MALVQLAQVSKVYRSLQGSDYVAVRDFTLDIEAGEFFCLLGTSGCGKTTVLNMVAGFEPVSAGDIRVAGKPIVGPDADSIEAGYLVSILISGALSQAFANEPDLPWGEGRFTPQFARAMGVLPALYPPRAARRKR